MIPRSQEPERGFVLAVLAQGADPDDELAEVEELARTAGVEPVGRVVQHRPRPAQEATITGARPSVFRTSRTARRVCIIGTRRKGRQDLASDLAFRVSLGVDVDVPLAGLKLPGLIWGQGGLPVDRVFHRTPLFDQPD